MEIIALQYGSHGDGKREWRTCRFDYLRPDVLEQEAPMVSTVDYEIDFRLDQALSVWKLRRVLRGKPYRRVEVHLQGEDESDPRVDRLRTIIAEHNATVRNVAA